MWLSSDQWKTNRRDVRKFWDIGLQRKNTNSPFLFPFLLGGMLMWQWLLGQSSQSTRWKLRMVNKTSEAAGGSDPAKTPYLWHEAEECISLLFKPLYLWVSCDGSLICIITEIIGGILWGLPFVLFELGKFHVCSRSWSKIGKTHRCSPWLPPSVSVSTIITTVVLVITMNTALNKPGDISTSNNCNNK